jgi:FKBP-type peptidyl-prolyl cis-trans isomerase FklB
MKKMGCIAALLFSLGGLAQKPPVRSTLQVPRIVTATDSIQYALGAFLGLWITNNGLSVTNAALFQKGFDDVLQGRARLIPDSLISPRIDAYMQSMVKNKGIQQERELFTSLRDIPGMGMFPSGVRYIVFRTGPGARPTAKDSIVLNLTAKLPDGTVIEDTYQSKKPFRATITSFFPGLNEALQMMTEGSRWQLYIPAVLAYGEKGSGLIPANSALILEVELLAVKPANS